MNGKNFFELSLSDLDEKNDLNGLQKRTKQETDEIDKLIIYSICHNEKDRHGQVKKSFLLDS